jgi:hypothetical protein
VNQPIEETTSDSVVVSTQKLESDTFNFIGITAGSVSKKIKKISSWSKNCFQYDGLVDFFCLNDAIFNDWTIQSAVATKRGTDLYNFVS